MIMKLLGRILGAALAALLLLGTPVTRAALYDMVEMTVASAPGLGTITLGIAVPPFRSLSATSVLSGETVSYHISDGLKWENGRGVVNLSPNITITRGVISSSNANALITAGAGATVWITPMAADMVMTQYPSSVLAPVSEPPCTPSNTSGTITLTLTGCPDPTKGVGYWQVTLTGNGTLAISGATAGAGFQLDVIEGSGPFTMTVPTGLFFPSPSLCTGNGAPAAYCTATNQLVLSGVAQGKNAFYCRVASNTPTFTCGSVLSGLVQASPYVVVAHNPGVACSGAGATTCATTLTLAAGGGTLFIGVGYCEAANCATTGTNAVSTITGTGLSGCSVGTGAKPSVAQAVWAEVWECTTVPSGSTTITATMGGSVFYANVAIAQVGVALIDDGKGAFATGTSSTSTVSTAATTQANEFIFDYTFLINGTLPAAGTGYTAIDAAIPGGIIGELTEYSPINAAGVNTATASFSSTTWATAIDAFHL